MSDLITMRKAPVMFCNAGRGFRGSACIASGGCMPSEQLPRTSQSSCWVCSRQSTLDVCYTHSSVSSTARIVCHIQSFVPSTATFVCYIQSSASSTATFVCYIHSFLPTTIRVKNHHTSTLTPLRYLQIVSTLLTSADASLDAILLTVLVCLSGQC